MVARATVEGYVAEGEEELMVESDEGEESDEVDEDSNGESKSSLWIFLSFGDSFDASSRDDELSPFRSLPSLTFRYLTDEDFYRNDYPDEEAGDSEDSYGDGIGSGAEDRWEEDY